MPPSDGGLAGLPLPFLTVKNTFIDVQSDPVPQEQGRHRSRSLPLTLEAKLIALPDGGDGDSSKLAFGGDTGSRASTSAPSPSGTLASSLASTASPSPARALSPPPGSPPGRAPPLRDSRSTFGGAFGADGGSGAGIYGGGPLDPSGGIHEARTKVALCLRDALPKDTGEPPRGEGKRRGGKAISICLRDALPESDFVLWRQPRANLPPCDRPRTKLTTKASLFTPKGAAPAAPPLPFAPLAPALTPERQEVPEECVDDMRMVISAVQAAIMKDALISRVQVTEGPLGGVTRVVAELSAGAGAGAGAGALALARGALLEATSHTQLIYVLGNGHQLSNGVESSFTASVAIVPLSQHQCACWDTYQKGFCPRPLACLWRHPTPADIMELVVLIRKSGCEPRAKGSPCGCLL